MITKPDIKKQIDEAAVEAFIKGSSQTAAPIQSIEPVEDKIEVPKKAAENKKEVVEETKAYNIKIPVSIYEKIENYVFAHRKEGAKIKNFLLDAIAEKVERENL